MTRYFAFTKLLVATLTSGCLIGGSNEDPRGNYQPVDRGLDSGIDPAGATAGPSRPDTSTSRADAATQSVTDPSRLDGGALRDGSVVSQDGSASRCMPATPSANCDPVHNTGCIPFLSQCDLDTSAASFSGRCVLGALSFDAKCASDVFSTTCPAQQTCANGACRAMCYCNADCAPGECCTGAVPGSSQAVKLCQKC